MQQLERPASTDRAVGRYGLQKLPAAADFGTSPWKAFKLREGPRWLSLNNAPVSIVTVGMVSSVWLGNRNGSPTTNVTIRIKPLALNDHRIWTSLISGLNKPEGGECAQHPLQVLSTNNCSVAYMLEDQYTGPDEIKAAKLPPMKGGSVSIYITPQTS